MTVQDLLARLVAALEAAGIPYMLTGSYASKLRWAKIGESERQVEDAATVIRLQGAKLDIAYVERQVRKLGIEQQWQLARARAAR